MPNDSMGPVFKKFGDLTDDQQLAVERMYPSWGPDKLRRFEYRVTKKGDLSRKKGDHRPTEEWSREIDRMLNLNVLMTPTSANSGPTATRDQPVRRTGAHQMHLGSNKD